jgi:hypothetical protein
MKGLDQKEHWFGKSTSRDTRHDGGGCRAATVGGKVV